MKKNIVFISTILLLVLGGSAFYWYEWRPSSIRKACYTESIDKARELLKTKSELSGGSIYEEAVKKGLNLKDDQNELYKDCLSKHGLSN